MDRGDLHSGFESSQLPASHEDTVEVIAYTSRPREEASSSLSPNADATLVETSANVFEIDMEPSSAKPTGIKSSNKTSNIKSSSLKSNKITVYESRKTSHAVEERPRHISSADIGEELEQLDQAVKPTTFPIFSRGVQLYCLAMLCGSLMKACSKLLVEQLNLFVVLFARMSITVILSMIVMHHLGVEHYFWGHKDIRVLLFIRGALGFFNIACTYFSLQYLSLPDLAVISFLTPMTTSVGARLFLKEKYSWQQAVASCVSLLGVVVIARPAWLFGSHEAGAGIGASVGADPTTGEQQGSATQWAALRTAAVTSSMCVVITASAVMIILRKIKDRAHALTSVANYAVLSVVGSALALLFEPWNSWHFPPDPKMWGLVLLMGLFGFMLQFLSSKAIQMEEATTLSNFKYTQLLYATTLEFIFWHDIPDFISFVGMVLILAGVYWSARAKAHQNI